jgi:hypothetical protein
MVEYCFSDPIRYSGAVGVDTFIEEGYLVFIAPKEGSYPKNLKDYECTDQEYEDLQDTGIYGSEKNPFAYDVRDHVFLIIEGELGKEKIHRKLRSLRFSPNKSLNSLLGDWVAEMGGKVLEDSEIPAKMPARIPAKRGRKPGPRSQIQFGKTGS